MRRFVPAFVLFVFLIPLVFAQQKDEESFQVEPDGRRDPFNYFKVLTSTNGQPDKPEVAVATPTAAKEEAEPAVAGIVEMRARLRSMEFYLQYLGGDGFLLHEWEMPVRSIRQDRMWIQQVEVSGDPGRRDEAAQIRNRAEEIFQSVLAYEKVFALELEISGILIEYEERPVSIELGLNLLGQPINVSAAVKGARAVGTVLLNGDRYRAGSKLPMLQGLVLEDVQPHGIVVAYRRIRVRVPSN